MLKRMRQEDHKFKANLCFAFKGWGDDLVGKCLLSNHEDLSSNPSTHAKQSGKMAPMALYSYCCGDSELAGACRVASVA